MRRLLILSLLMAVVTSVLALAAVGVGRAQPDRPDWLHLRDCALPCWAGMTPGLTPIGDVKQRLSALMLGSGRSWMPSSPLDAHNPFFTWSSVDRLTGVSINLFAENDGKTASLIGIGSDHRDSLMPRLGDALLAFGPPTCVIAASDLSLFNLIYEDRAAGSLSEIDTDSLRWTSPIRSFSAETEGALLTCGKLRGNRWRGLYPAWQYLID
jgi:hypothetical protein